MTSPGLQDGRASGRSATLEGEGWEQLSQEAGRFEAAAEASDRREYVVFSLEDSCYALPIEQVREIVRLRPITPVPRVPRALRGVISLRGEITQVVDLRLCLGMEALEPTRTTRIIVLGREDATTGLLVDAVRDVIRATADDIRPAPAGDSDSVAALCVRGHEFISLLDTDRILDLDTER